MITLGTMEHDDAERLGVNQAARQDTTSSTASGPDTPTLVRTPGERQTTTGRLQAPRLRGPRPIGLMFRPIGLRWQAVPRPRFERLPRSRQREVLDAAASEFARHGYEGASFNRIMAGAGVSKGATYYWFADKADLYQTVVRESVDRMVAAMGHIEPAASKDAFWRQVCQHFEDVGRFYREDPAAAVLALSVARGENTDDLDDQGRKWFEMLVAEGRRSGAMRTDVPAELSAEVVWSMTEAADRWLVRNRLNLGPDPGATVETVTAAVAEMVRRAFEPPAQRKATDERRD